MLKLKICTDRLSQNKEGKIFLFDLNGISIPFFLEIDCILMGLKMRATLELEYKSFIIGYLIKKARKIMEQKKENWKS